MLTKNAVIIVFAMACLATFVSCKGSVSYCSCDYVKGKDTVRTFDPIYGDRGIAKDDCMKREKDSVYINLNCEFK